MLDIGLGEVALIAVLALLVFGPDRLPKVAADAARALRQVREMASAARRDLVDAAGVEQDEELTGMLSDLRELNPRRVLDPLPPQRPAGRGEPAPPATGAAVTGERATGAAATGGSTGAAATGGATGVAAPAPAPPEATPDAADPDWS